MNISVIIVSYNFERWIDRCLGSLRRQTQPPHTVYVADNGSADRTVAIIRERYPEVVLIENGENLGFARANNEVARRAIAEGADALFLMNEDTWLATDCLAQLAATASQHPLYGILSPVHLDGTGKKLDSGFAGYTGLDSPEAAEACGIYREVHFVNAAFWLIRAEVWKHLDGFSPRFCHYGEDTDFVNRLHHAGYPVAFCGTALACHDREKRPVSREKFFVLEEVFFRSVIFNPANSRLKGYLFGVAAPVKKALTCLVKGRSGEAGKYLVMSRKLYKEWKELKE